MLFLMLFLLMLLMWLLLLFLLMLLLLSLMLFLLMLLLWLLKVCCLYFVIVVAVVATVVVLVISIISVLMSCKAQAIISIMDTNIKSQDIVVIYMYDQIITCIETKSTQVLMVSFRTFVHQHNYYLFIDFCLMPYKYVTKARCKRKTVYD